MSILNFLNYSLIIFASAILAINSKSIPSNNTAIISKYAKVANFGAVPISTTQRPISEGRSSGQSLWTHRSDVNIVGGQNLKTSKPAVVYHYAVHKKPSEKIGSSHGESVPAVGEVQERFNPRPYFDYVHLPSKYPSSKQSSSDNKPDPAPSPTFDSFPVFKPPSSNPPSSGIYDSPISSYSPPNAGTVSPADDSNPDVAYPPNGPPPPGDTGDINPPPPPPSDASPGYSYNPPSSPPEDKPANPPQNPPYDHPPTDEHVYYPPSDNGHPEVILDHPPPGWEEPKDMKDQPPAGMMMGAPAQDMKGHDMAEHDLSPPPSADYQGRFPQYLYSDPHAQGHDHDFGTYDFDHHHVYKEVTTTPAPEDERVNKGHYSYYYLGRKLWYIPLYFSVYFVVYVTVLILKSIARHKIQFKHEHFHRGARMMDSHEEIDEIHRNVTAAIDTTRKKFPYIAM